MRRVAILISGGGSNMLALVRDMVGDHPARPVLVASNDPRAGGLAKAAELGIATAAAEQQAIDRAHRIGQTQPVTVFRLIAEHSVEEKILALQDRKKDLAAQMLAGDKLEASLTEEDFTALLSLK